MNALLTRVSTVFGSAVIVFMSVSLMGCGGSSCEQDYPPPTEIITSNNPYHIGFYSSDLGISSARWVNITTGGAGPGTVSQAYECFFPIGCGTWSHVEADVYLATGLNTVYLYHSSDGCEWRDDYLITYN